MKTTAFIGLGMVGGSLARGMAGAGDRILGWDQLPGVRSLAKRSGIEIIEPLEMAEEADLIVVATPPDRAGTLIRELLRSGARAVTDTASVKVPVAAALEGLDPELSCRWIGGHPMAGTQNSGWESADPKIFTGMTWALCSDVQPRLDVLLEVSRLVDVFDGAMLPVSPEDHDQAVAFSSHSVQIIQQVLAAGLSDRPALFHRLSGPGLRDSTRLAESPLDGMWEEIIEENRPALLDSIEGLIGDLEQARQAIDDRNSEEIRALWRAGSLGRERLIDLRWQKRYWRRASLPLGRWWPELLQLGRNGTMIRRPHEDSGALLLFERG